MSNNRDTFEYIMFDVYLAITFFSTSGMIHEIPPTPIELHLKMKNLKTQWSWFYLLIALTLSQIGDQNPLKNLSLLLLVSIDFSVLNCDFSEAITWASLGGLPSALFFKNNHSILFMTGSNFGSPKMIWSVHLSSTQFYYLFSQPI